jgi:hypothetical protein
MVSDLSRTQQRVLADYYWFGRDIDVDDIFQYRRDLMTRHPQIRQEAERALRNFFIDIRVSDDPGDYAAWI